MAGFHIKVSVLKMSVSSIMLREVTGHDYYSSP
jgi:hypothetical protein